MKTKLYLPASLLFIFCQISVAQVPEFQWAKSMGGSSTDYAAGTSVAADKAGNVYTTGYFFGTVDMNPDQNVTLNLSSGNPDNPDIFVQKLDKNGNFKWAKRMGTPAGVDAGNSIAVDFQGNVYTTGFFNGDVDFNPGSGTNILYSEGGTDIYVQKLDSVGNFKWAERMGSETDIPYLDIGTAITVDDAGDIYCTGRFSGNAIFGDYVLESDIVTVFVQKLNSSGIVQWAKNLDVVIDFDATAPAIVADAYSQVYVTANALNADFASDIFTFKLDASGTTIWERYTDRVWGSFVSSGYGVVVDASGNVYTTGVFRGFVDFDPGPSEYTLNTMLGTDSAGSWNGFIQKLNASGDFVWAKRIGANVATPGYYEETKAYATTIGASGNLYTIGDFYGETDFDPSENDYPLLPAGNSDIFILELDNNGNFIWAGSMGSTLIDAASCIAVDDDGNIYTTGLFEGLAVADFDPGDNTTYLYTTALAAAFVQKSKTVSSPIIVKNVIADNPAFTDFVLWSGNTNSKPVTLKVCADGSEATHIEFTNTNAVINSIDIGFRIKGDPYANNEYEFGSFNDTVVGNVITAIYHHPTYLSSTYTPYRTDTLQVYNIVNPSQVLFEIPMEIYRAPLILIHGMYGSPTGFDAMKSQLASLLYFNVSEELITTPNFTNASLKGVQAIIDVVPDAINDGLRKCRNNGFSAGKVDLIGHSLGGIISRLYLQGNNGVTYRNDVNLILTIGTPHSGAYLADYGLSQVEGLCAITIYMYGYPGKLNYCPATIEDLAANGYNIDQELNGTLLNAHIVPCATIATQIDNNTNPTACGFFSKISSASTLLSCSDFYSKIFNGDLNDLAVSVSSQKGGLTGSKTIVYAEQGHLGSNTSNQVIARCEFLLSQDPKSIYFSQNGFHPVPLSYDGSPSPPQNDPQGPPPVGDVTITSPSNSSSFSPGDVVTINVTGTSNIAKLTLTVGNSMLPFFAENAFASSASFSYTVPLESYGEIRVIVVGIDADTNFVDLDTLKFNASTTATLDSLSIDQPILYIPQGESKYFQLNGHFSDGITRDLSSEAAVQYSIANPAIAQYVPTNGVKGLLISNTTLSINYLGKSLQVPIEVYTGKGITNYNYQSIKFEWADGNILHGSFQTMTVDAPGNTYVIGNYNGTVDLDPGMGTFLLTSPLGSVGYWLYLQKLDASGNLVWAKNLSSINLNYVSAIADASGNLYFTGYFSGSPDFDPGAGIFTLTTADYALAGDGSKHDIFVQKLDPSGNFIWAKSIGGYTALKDFDFGKKVAVDGASNIYVRGLFYGTVDFNPGPQIVNLIGNDPSGNTFTLKLDASGNFIWAKIDGSALTNNNYFVGVDSLGNSYKVINLSSSLYSIIKEDANGNAIWTKSIYPTNFSDGISVASAIDAQGNVYIAGYFQGTIDLDPGAGVFLMTENAGDIDETYYCLKLDAAGNFMWGIKVAIVDYGTGMISDPSGNIIISGQYRETTDFDPGPGTFNLALDNGVVGERFIQKIDASGKLLWANKFGDFSNQIIGAVIGTDVYDNLFIGGNFYATFDFDPGVNVSNLTSYYNGTYYEASGFVTKWGNCIAPPSTITPSGFICTETETKLTSNAGSGLTYQWRKDGKAKSAATNKKYTASTDGEYRVEVTESGCTSLSEPVFISSFPTASITPPDTVSICSGATTILSTSYDVGLTYLWFKNGISISGATSYVYYNIADAGMYTVQVTNSFGCSAVSAATMVNVNPVPAGLLLPSGMVAICSGASAQLTTDIGIGLSYQWFLDGIVISGATINTYYASSAGAYTVQVTNSSGCSKISLATSVIVNPAPAATISPAISISICSGEKTTLTANSGSGLSWQWLKDGVSISGATSKTYKVDAQGDYKVKVTNSNGCSKTSSATTVNVNALPIATITPSGTVSICTGTSTTLTANTGTGLTYKWLKDNVLISGATNNTYATSVGAKYTVEVTNASGCKLVSAATTVSIVAIPTATISPSGTVNICAGITLTLTANSSGSGLTYKWLKDGTAISGATAKTYKPTASGQYKVKITNTTGCSKTSAATIVNVNPLPTATITPSGTVNICMGATATLTANAGSGLSYQWKKETVNIAGATNNTYTITSTEDGKFTVEVTTSLGCSFVSENTTIKRLADPNAVITVLNGGNLNICTGEVKLKGPGTAGTLWLWYNGTTPIAGATSQNYIPTVAGTYKVEVTNTDGCTKKSDVGVQVVKPCKEGSIADNEASFNIYPNPTNGNFVIELTLNEEINQPAIVQVFNILGQVVITENIPVVDGVLFKEMKLDRTTVAGMYSVRVMVNNETFQKQVIYQQ